MAIRVDPATLDILGRARTNGQVLHLTGDLDRRSYAEVAKVIELAGGRWDKKARAHLFDRLAEEALEQVLLTGQISNERQELGAFFTPPELAARVIAAAGLQPGMRVLEPSAGRGALAAPALLAGCLVDCVEIDPKNVRILCSTQYARVVAADFLAQQPLLPVYDRVLMNPPFARQQDVAHVVHAARFLKPDGRLVAITSAGVLFRTDRRTERLKRLIAAGQGAAEALPDNSFVSAGTTVRTALVTLEATPALLTALRET